MLRKHSYCRNNDTAVSANHRGSLFLDILISSLVCTLFFERLRNFVQRSTIKIFIDFRQQYTILLIWKRGFYPFTLYIQNTVRSKTGRSINFFHPFGVLYISVSLTRQKVRFRTFSVRLLLQQKHNVSPTQQNTL